MQCRKNCGACCVIPSISSYIPGMTDGKPAGIPCIHLTADLRCGIFNRADRPTVCAGFKAEEIICGNSRKEAIENLANLQGLQLTML